MSRYQTIAILDEISALDAVRNSEPYLRALQQAVEALNDQSADPPEPLYFGGARPEQIRCMPERLYPMDPPPPESLLERRAWEILMQHLRPGQAVRVEDCFDIAERFAAEAAKRRGGS